MNLSTRQIRSFLALCELRSFTRAADHVGLSQPALSAQIRSLEDTLGARLFDRDSRKVDLTPAGRRFETAARDVLTHFDAVMSAACRDLGRTARVAVAGMPSLCARFLPVVVADYRKRHPDVEIEIVDALPQQCADLVRDGKVDLAVTSMRSADPQLHRDLLCTDRFHAVVHADHPLASRRNVPLAELAALPFIHFTRSTLLREQIDDAIRPGRIHHVLEVERLEAIKGLVESGVGVSVVPGLTLFHFASGRIATRPLAAPGITRDIFLLTGAARSPTPAAEALMDLVRDRMAGIRDDAGDLLDPTRLDRLVPVDG